MPVITPETARAHPDRMSETRADPAHAAYDHAAAVLASAQALEAATRPAGSVAATPPTLACLETSLDALALTVARLRAHTLDRLADPLLPSENAQVLRARTAVDLAHLVGTLGRAASACAEARDSLAPVAGELTVGCHAVTSSRSRAADEDGDTGGLRRRRSSRAP